MFISIPDENEPAVLDSMYNGYSPYLLEGWLLVGQHRTFLPFPSYVVRICYPFNNRFLRERGMASNPQMEYQVFLCIFQKNSAMATLGLKEMGTFLWEGREKGLPCWLSQFSKTKLRQPTGETFFPSVPKEFSPFPSNLR